MGVLVEAEAVAAGSVGCADVLVAPCVVLDRAVEIAAVADHLAVDFLDSGLVQGGPESCNEFRACIACSGFSAGTGVLIENDSASEERGIFLVVEAWVQRIVGAVHIA